MADTWRGYAPPQALLVAYCHGRAPKHNTSAARNGDPAGALSARERGYGMTELARRAKREGLRYAATDELPLTRRKSGRGFAYFDRKGRLIRDRAVIDRIN